MPYWLKLLQGFLTPVIAAIAVYIAYQQWQGNRLKLQLERYDRRLRIYQRVMAFLGVALRDFKPDPQEVISFRVDTAEADFLFGPEIPSYIAEIARNALSSRVAHLEYCDTTKVPPPGYDHQKVVDEISRHSKWLVDQMDVVNGKFKPYLDISQ